MVAGAQPAADGSPSFDVALFVGYHARAGHGRGTIAHTYSGAPVETRLDGRPTGEYGLNAVVLGAWGIPVGLVAGDDALAEEVADWLPWAERVIVKTADGGLSAASPHPSVARDLVRAGAERAVRAAAAGSLQPLVVGPPVTIEVEYARASPPTTRPSCPAPSASATGRCASRRTTPRRRSAGSWPGSGWPGAVG